MEVRFTYNDDPVYLLGKCDDPGEGIVGYDVKLRPARLGPGEYTFVGSPGWLVPVETREEEVE